MAKSKGKPSGNGRLSWDGRLWDPSGVLYEREVEELTRSEALALVRDPDIQVAVSHASRPLRWLASDQRQTVWLEEVDPNFHDEPNWKPPTGAPGQLRTGFLALLLLHLCGVSGADIASDYALSMEQMIERDPGYAEELTKLLERHETSIERAITAVVAEPILETLTVGGLQAEDLQALRARFLET